VDLDQGVVDAHAAQCGQNMLGGRDERTVAVTENGGKLGGGDGIEGGLDLAVASVEAGADEHDPGVDRRGAEGQADGSAGMYADTSDGGLRTKRGLPAEFHRLSPKTPPECPAGRPSRNRLTFRYPQVTADLIEGPKERQLTLLYGLLPHLCRIRSEERRVGKDCHI